MANILRIDYIYVKQLPQSAIGDLSDLTIEPVNPPYFDEIVPNDAFTIAELLGIVIHLKSSDPLTSTINWSTITAEINGVFFSTTYLTDGNISFALSGSITDTIITIAFTTPIITDLFIVTFRGQDSYGISALPYRATFLIWGGTMANPLLLHGGLAAYTEPQPMPNRWEHCYDSIKVSWKFLDEEGEVLRGVTRGARKEFSLESNPLVQTPNLAAHAADILLTTFGRERRELSQALPFAPFIDPYDVVQLLYPSKRYALSRIRKWITTELHLSLKSGKLTFKGLESHEEAE